MNHRPIRKCGEHQRDHGTRREAEQHEVGHRIRRRPLLDESDAGIDHRGANPQRDTREQRKRADQRCATPAEQTQRSVQQHKRHEKR